MLFPSDHKSSFHLVGPAGRVQAASTWPRQAAPAAIVVICHPHPLGGGTMNNKVVTTVVRAADHLGLASLRFNFRGVGESEGSYDQAVGECDDLRAVLAWVATVVPNLPICLVGFSFGSYISSVIANEQSPLQLMSIAPAVNHHDYTQFTNITCPWLVIQGEQDEVVPYAAVKSWCEQMPQAPQLITFPGCTHFFHGHLLTLQQVIESALRNSRLEV